MKLFVWEAVSKVTSNWHDGGSVAVVAEDLAAACDQLKLEAPGCEALSKTPDRTYELADDKAKPEVFLFPNAGCC